MKSRRRTMGATAGHRARGDRVAACGVRVRRHATRRTRVRAHGCGRRRPIAATRSARFLGKVDADTARCRGGERATSSARRALCRLAGLLGRCRRGQPGERIDQRRRVGGATRAASPARCSISSISGSSSSSSTCSTTAERIEHYVQGRDGVAGPALKVWNEMRLPTFAPDRMVQSAAMARSSAAAS